jgi:hypothetical protein
MLEGLGTASSFKLPLRDNCAGFYVVAFVKSLIVGASTEPTPTGRFFPPLEARQYARTLFQHPVDPSPVDMLAAT